MPIVLARSLLRGAARLPPFRRCLATTRDGSYDGYRPGDEAPAAKQKVGSASRRAEGFVPVRSTIIRTYNPEEVPLSPHYYFRYQMFDLHRKDPELWDARKLSEKFRLPKTEIAAMLKLLEYEDEVMSRDFDRTDERAVALHNEAEEDMRRHRSGAIMKEHGVKMPAANAPIPRQEPDELALQSPVYGILDEDDAALAHEESSRSPTVAQRERRRVSSADEEVEAPSGWRVLNGGRLNGRPGKAGIKGRAKAVGKRRRAKIVKVLKSGKV